MNAGSEDETIVSNLKIKDHRINLYTHGYVNVIISHDACFTSVGYLVNLGNRCHAYTFPYMNMAND
ncbi:hypothetical protein [Carboxylicivirga marina]|uniref:hypothetical protein n=1 Tax=Carboxylicivirga marina TaxID=2800988 RepID=UPI0025992B76|nr:hypothetical protein [uncultured Carboxylicivirga sp.]